MISIELLRKIEGWHTPETLASDLNIKRQSAINLISRLKKEGYVKTMIGGRRKRIYMIKARKQRERDPGMFDIINKYSTKSMQLAEWYDHQVHGTYGPEEALIDALDTKSFRVILASMRLFNHITNWPKLYKLAKEKNCWQKVGALYDVARLFIKIRKMPEKYLKYKIKRKKWVLLSKLKKKNFIEIANKWHVYIPFNKYDMRSVQ